MVLFPIALIWVAAVLFFIIRRSLNEPEEQEGNDPPRFQRPQGDRPRDGRGPLASRRARRGSRSHSA